MKCFICTKKADVVFNGMSLCAKCLNEDGTEHKLECYDFLKYPARTICKQKHEGG